MELYFFPPEDDPLRTLRREQVVSALESRGLRPKVSAEGSFWVVSFEASSVFISFQEQNGLLVFATVDQSIFESSDLPVRFFEALEGLGWGCDESVG